eukprot:5173844-Pyramimonas_sp.AAC.1
MSHASYWPTSSASGPSGAPPGPPSSCMGSSVASKMAQRAPVRTCWSSSSSKHGWPVAGMRAVSVGMRGFGARRLTIE